MRSATLLPFPVRALPYGVAALNFGLDAMNSGSQMGCDAPFESFVLDGRVVVDVAEGKNGCSGQRSPGEGTTSATREIIARRPCVPTSTPVTS